MVKTGVQPVGWLLALVVAALAGCGEGGPQSLDAFSQQWYRAVNQGQTDELYDLLDAASRRKLARDLEQMRGLDPQAQRAVLNQLGGVQVQSLHELTPRQYFGRLWHQALQGLQPTMRITAADEDSAYMELGLPDSQSVQRVRLFVEGGRWVWQLPEQRFDAPAP